MPLLSENSSIASSSEGIRFSGTSVGAAGALSSEMKIQPESAERTRTGLGLESLGRRLLRGRERGALARRRCKLQYLIEPLRIEGFGKKVLTTDFWAPSAHFIGIHEAGEKNYRYVGSVR